jgi:hypothetical protein
MALLAVTTLAGIAFVAAAPVSAAPIAFDVTLLSSNEVPPNASGSSGVALITVDPVADQVCWQASFNSLTGPTVAQHIHHAAAGVNGPIVVTLTFNAGCAAVDSALADDIVAHPSDYYANYHTQTNPGGEVRGQLVPRVIPPPLTLDTAPTTTTTPTTVPETSQPVTTEPEVTTTTASVTSTTTGTGVRPASGARPVSGRPTFTG